MATPVALLLHPFYLACCTIIGLRKDITTSSIGSRLSRSDLIGIVIGLLLIAS
ncbi:hypothetical protein [Tengunoibacter tsumagoiensis]|uniref:hypothetical protein n=1 Tax=Tengunoibacter tsumagoiensis TaxID=2014871 RepID=UPI0013875208|nr:hypothetical protein [Tengunoibacter tsumagoiensis]